MCVGRLLQPLAQGCVEAKVEDITRRLLQLRRRGNFGFQPLLDLRDARILLRDAGVTKERKRLEPPAGSPFMTIPSYGWKFYGLSKNGSYDAAARGDFGKLIEIGRRKFVAIATAEAKAKAAVEASEPRRTKAA